MMTASPANMATRLCPAAPPLFVSDPDPEALDQVGAETGNQNFLADVRDQRAERIEWEFKRRNPDYLPTTDNFGAMVKTLAYNSNLTPAEQHGHSNDLADLLIQRGYFTVENFQRVYDALDREGLLDVPHGTPRNVSESERLRVARIAQAGRTDEAIEFYLQCALPDEETTLELVNNPDFREIVDSGVWTVWETFTHDYTPTASREASRGVTAETGLSPFRC